MTQIREPLHTDRARSSVLGVECGRVLVIIPAYNEGESIGAVIHDLRRAAPDFDRLVVNDGSRDDTGATVEALGERQIAHACNLGYGHALQTGLRFAIDRRYDIAVFFDADGQHRAEDVPRLVASLIERRATVALGSRFGPDRPYRGPFGRRLGQQVLSLMSRLLLGQRIYDTTTGFKVVRSTVFDHLAAGAFMDFHMELLLDLKVGGFSVIEVPISTRERVHGQSMHSAPSAILYPLKTLFLTLVAASSGRRHRRSS